MILWVFERSFHTYSQKSKLSVKHLAMGCVFVCLFEAISWMPLSCKSQGLWAGVRAVWPREFVQHDGRSSQSAACCFLDGTMGPGAPLLPIWGYGGFGRYGASRCQRGEWPGGLWLGHPSVLQPRGRQGWQTLIHLAKPRWCSLLGSVIRVWLGRNLICTKIRVLVIAAVILKGDTNISVWATKNWKSEWMSQRMVCCQPDWGIQTWRTDLFVYLGWTSDQPCRNSLVSVKAYNGAVGEVCDGSAGMGVVHHWGRGHWESDRIPLVGGYLTAFERAGCWLSLGEVLGSLGTETRVPVPLHSWFAVSIHFSNPTSTETEDSFLPPVSSCWVQLPSVPSPLPSFPSSSSNHPRLPFLLVMAQLRKKIIYSRVPLLPALSNYWVFSVPPPHNCPGLFSDLTG